jgi:hypothetical protein
MKDIPDDDWIEKNNKINRFYILNDRNKLIVFLHGSIYISDLINFNFIKAFNGINYLSIGVLRQTNEDLFAINYY